MVSSFSDELITEKDKINCEINLKNRYHISNTQIVFVDNWIIMNECISMQSVRWIHSLETSNSKVLIKVNSYNPEKSKTFSRYTN